ncbi:Kef-type K+ transport system, membrane component [Ignavibacterium album JCM 16511]|uniref:Kef-type K+ transport system, membrane component n=1 Tax=Ignavibacterium album (strain DSM 19864 / JCM 16511 / NBRC 101810 / Mat9-16) TaxID=945713 RepID=I0ANE9_IGNAJ|nr:cation:proton antiporter [Ignavibacterium album]AFH50506.1 Kef-type K+ transport system, membrane component [Ignavibacterium album JCM 16511]
MHIEILTLLLQLFALLSLAKILAEIAQRFNLPIVVGEIFAGIILGPSLLGNFQFYREYFLPDSNSINYIDVFVLIGSMLLLFIAGLQTDIKLLKHYSRNAIVITIFSFAVSFLFTFSLLQFIAPLIFSGFEKSSLLSLFVSSTLAISAISVVAKVLIDLNFIRRDFGQLAVAIGMIDETIIWIIISVLLGFVSATEFSVNRILYSTIKVIGFIALGTIIGKILISRFIILTQNILKLKYKFISLTFLTIFLFGLIAQFLNLEPVLGAFIAGLIFSQIPGLLDDTIDKIESLTFSVFAPIFFASAGLKVDIRDFADFNILILSLLITIFASFGKAIGAYLSARFISKFNHWLALSLSISLNTRGTIQIIIATIGLATGIISQEIFSAIIIASVISSLSAPIMMKLVIKKIEPSEEEIFRLKKEETFQKSILSKINRVLVPVRLRSDFDVTNIKTIETKLLEKINSKKPLMVTLLTVVSENEKMIAQNFLNNLQSKLETLKVDKRIIVSEKPLESILNNLKTGYDLLVVGATEKVNTNDSVINPFIDHLIKLAPCYSLIISSSVKYQNKNLNKILVPVDGSLASKRAAELAFSFSDPEKDEVHLLRVIERKSNNEQLIPDLTMLDRQYEYAKAILDSIKEIGESFQIRTFTRIEVGESPENVILRAANEYEFDLVVIGTEIKPGTEKLYLGPRVERILNNCSCPVAVFNSQ